MSFKLVFFGTPQVACPFLKKLIDSGYPPIATITQPDKKGGRGMSLICSPVKKNASEFNIPVFQPANSEELNKKLEELKPDLGIVVAYGFFFKTSSLSIPKYGFINVHFSLLPSYRGADPVRRAILNGEKETGVTIFKIDEGMDTGPILSQRKISIGEEENYLSLLNRLAVLGCELMIEVVENIKLQKAIYIPQTGKTSYAPKIKMEETFLDFSKKNTEVFNKIRAFCCDPFARAIFNFKGKDIIIQIISASLRNSNINVLYPPGTMVDFEKGRGVFVKCLEGDIFIEKIKQEGGKIVNAFDYFVNGKYLKKGDIIFKTRVVDGK